ncbi:MAG: hypothetical protein ACLRIS_17300 [Flavonifractor plautii]
MFRSLHMKLMLIMTLLIISLMTVVGAFLINSVANYYTQDFYTQMSEAFGDPDFWKDLETPSRVRRTPHPASPTFWIPTAPSALTTAAGNTTYWTVPTATGWQAPTIRSPDRRCPMIPAT